MSELAGRTQRAAASVHGRGLSPSPPLPSGCYVGALTSSITTTCSPRLSSASATAPPMKPAPPVTRTGPLRWGGRDVRMARVVGRCKVISWLIRRPSPTTALVGEDESPNPASSHAASTHAPCPSRVCRAGASCDVSAHLNAWQLALGGRSLGTRGVHGGSHGVAVRTKCVARKRSLLHSATEQSEPPTSVIPRKIPFEGLGPEPPLTAKLALCGHE